MSFISVRDMDNWQFAISVDAIRGVHQTNSIHSTIHTTMPEAQTIKTREDAAAILAKIEAAKAGKPGKFWLTKEEALAAGVGNHDHLRYDSKADDPICLYYDCEKDAFPIWQSNADLFAIMPPLQGGAK